MTIVTALPLEKRKPITQIVKSSITPRVAAPLSKSSTNADQKNKTTVTEQFKTGLHVVIYRAEDIDKCEEIHTNGAAEGVKNRGYNVVHWIKPGKEIHTKVVEGVTPEWNQSDVIMLENLDDYCLNVEVQRFNSLADPGSLSDKVVVGRVKIPIPVALDRRKVGSFPLLRTDGKLHRVEGRVLLSMRLQRIEPGSSFQVSADDLFF